MAKNKKLVAVTNIKHNNTFTPAGTTIENVDDFSRDQLTRLYDIGAVKIVDIEPLASTIEETTNGEGDDT